MVLDADVEAAWVGVASNPGTKLVLVAVGVTSPTPRPDPRTPALEEDEEEAIGVEVPPNSTSSCFLEGVLGSPGIEPEPEFEVEGSKVEDEATPGLGKGKTLRSWAALHG